MKHIKKIFLVAPIFILFCSANGGFVKQTKIYELQNRPKLYFIGLKVRTNNHDEMGKNGKLPGLWKRFFSENVAQNIPNKTSSNLYALYYEYQQDENGPYSALIGCQVSSLQTIPTELVGASIPEATYAKLKSKRGPFQTIVPEIWTKVWKLWSQNTSIQPRRYSGDFEEYGPQAQDPLDAEIFVYISVK